MKCKKCQTDVRRFKGEVVAYSIWALTPLWFYLFGPASTVTFIGFGFYSYKIYNSTNFIFNDCLLQNCPDCNKEIFQNNYCHKCKIIVCKFCRNKQSHEKGTSWLKASILFPVTLIIAIGLSFIDPWLVPIAYIFYVIITSPKCNVCEEKIYLLKT